MTVYINNKLTSTSSQLFVLTNFAVGLTFGAPLSIINSTWRWYLNGILLSPLLLTQLSSNIAHSSNASILSIPTITANHAGNYTCVLKANIQTLSHSIIIIVQDQQVQIKLIQPSVILAGHNVTLDCITTLTPNLSPSTITYPISNTFRWYINNTIITSSKFI